MPLARTFDPASGRIVTTLRDAYLDRLSRWSDIQEYLPFLYEQARSRPGCRVLELGARRGNSTLAFLAGAAESGGHVWSCDVENVLRYPDGIGPWRDAPHWTFVCGDDMHPAVRAALPAEADVFFLDTSHEYEHTLAELRAYMPRLAPGGVALFHDTNIIGWPGYSWDRGIPPVQAALNDWCAETGTTWENLPGDYGLGVIRRDGEPPAA
jgi:predicted O-methyltransferase YrrM